jgi:hypothetical protein
MIAVRNLFYGATAAAPHTEPSRCWPVAQATHAQVTVRSLAEQLVCEANAVLSDHGESITLVDDSGPNEFAFTLGYRDRWARIRTALSGRTATAELVLAGAPRRRNQELTGEDQLQALVLTLVAGATDN